MRNRTLAGLVAAGTATVSLTLLGVGGAAGGAVGAPTSHRVQALPVVKPLAIEMPLTKVPKLTPAAVTAPPTLAECVSAGFACYDPTQIRNVYGLSHLIDRHHDGRGQTIVIIDAFGSPTIRADLRSFDAAYHIVAPKSFNIYRPLGAVHYRESSPDEQSWATETSLDVEWAHAMAPRATITLLEAPNDRNALAFGELEDYAYTHHLGHILSQSYGAAEQNYTSSSEGRQVLRSNESLYAKMITAGWTVLAAAGDSGVANANEETGESYAHPTVNYPASSIYNTGVGGTSLYASSTGQYGSEVAWNESATEDGAGGGGVSSYFSTPRYQKPLSHSVRRVLKGKRGVPDVSWDGDPATGFLLRCTATVACQDLEGFPGWALVGGTSAGAPQWAGLVADVTSAVGHPLGEINTFLYRTGRRNVGYHDIASGNNSYGGLVGYRSLPGFDLATGWGTPTTRLEQAMIRFFKS